MKYKELADFEVTPEQDEALSIECSALLNRITPGALLAKWVKERLLDDVVNQRIHQPREALLLNAFREAMSNNDNVKLRALAQAAQIDVQAIPVFKGPEPSVDIAVSQQHVADVSPPSVHEPSQAIDETVIGRLSEEVPEHLENTPEIHGLMDRVKSWLWKGKS